MRAMFFLCFLNISKKKHAKINVNVIGLLHDVTFLNKYI